jgi:ABC-type nitrate/sulfonate/bicarbonate transport system permease component
MATTEEIKQLRDLTGVSIMQCKKALEEAGDDIEKAKVILRKASAAIATGIVFVPTDYALEGGELFIALGASALRLLSAFLLALVFGIPLGLLAESNPRVEGMLLPVYDVLESMPILAFFPVIILFFIRSDFLEDATLISTLFVSAASAFSCRISVFTGACCIVLIIADNSSAGTSGPRSFDG